MRFLTECLRKNAYKTLEKANRVIKRQKVLNNVDLYAYFCPHCQNYHITKEETYKTKHNNILQNIDMSKWGDKMSSTNRSDARIEHISDYYITPQKDIELFCKNIINEVGDIFCGKIIFDCCGGGDKKYEMSYPAVLTRYFPKTIITTDIREDSRADFICDYLNTNVSKIMSKRLPEEYKNTDIIITNPPFNKAIEIIAKSLQDIKNGGYVIMLLRLNFFGSKSRYDFWQKNMPKYTFVHSKRIGFLPEQPNKTDSIEYMHCVWQKGYKTDFTKLMVI